MHRKDKQNVLKRAALASALIAIFAGTPLAAQAAGMGKITVLSALGQPLRAEMDVTASREELASLAARVAPVEAFRQANVEYSPALSRIRFVLDKRPDGKPYFRIQTEHVVNEPFIDFLVELSWSSGRLVREYAFLLDPPAVNADSAATSVTSPVVAQTTIEPAAQKQQNQTEARPASLAKRQPAEAAGGEAPATENGANSRKVKSGDTLGKIAAESAVEGVTLDQMLVALFNSNRDAFIGGNMNRLRAGRILNLPDAETATAVSVGEARKIVVAHSADFNAYRNSLATAAAGQAPVEQQGQQSSSGKITPKVEEKASSAVSEDKLQVSRSEAGAKAGKLSEEDVVAREKALKEANSRIAELEKNLASLKKLDELKRQPAAEAQKPPAAPVATPPAQEGGKEGLVVVPVPALSAVAAASETAVSAPVAAPVAEEMPQPKPKQKFVPPPPPPPPPSFIEENSLLVYGGGAALAGLLGLLGFRAWKRKRDAAGASVTVSDLASSSVFGAAASESAPPEAAPTDFGHSTFDAVDASGKEGVDPIQEAEVYMAYGRDGQAEEILVDAIQKDPGNLAVHLKLLEIYAGRKSLPQFNKVADDVHSLTGGSGPDWDKAAALGHALDPSNPLYGGRTPADLMPPATAVAPDHEPPMEATMVMEAPPVQEAPVEAAPAAEEEVPSALDFDLDLGAPSSVEAPPAAPVAETTGSDIDFDLDLGGEEKPAVEAATASDLDIDFNAPADVGNAIDFDLAPPAPVAETTAAAPVEAMGEPALDFDFDLGESAAPAPQEPAAPPLDLASISLDLDEPATPAPNAAADSAEVATKLELAQAYEEMGDREGARELLQEVLAEGSPAQQDAAREKLAQLD